MVQQYLWKGGGANWLWSALIDNIWIFEGKANFFSFGGCWVKILVPHSAVFLIQKAKTGLRGYVAEETSECQKKKRGGIVCDCLLTMEEFEYQTPTNRATFGLLFRIHENCIFGFLRLIIAKGTRDQRVKYFHKSDCRRNAAADLLPSYHQRFP